MMVLMTNGAVLPPSDCDTHPNNLTIIVPQRSADQNHYSQCVLTCLRTSCSFSRAWRSFASISICLSTYSICSAVS